MFGFGFEFELDAELPVCSSDKVASNSSISISGTSGNSSCANPSVLELSATGDFMGVPKLAT